MPSIAVWVLAVLVGTFGGPGAGAERIDVRSGVWMMVSGTVLSIDRPRRLLVLRHGPLETAPGGIVACALSSGTFLARLRRGDQIDALARTDHHPWLLRDARILERPPTEPAHLAAHSPAGPDRI